MWANIRCHERLRHYPTMLKSFKADSDATWLLRQADMMSKWYEVKSVKYPSSEAFNPAVMRFMLKIVAEKFSEINECLRSPECICRVRHLSNLRPIGPQKRRMP